MALSLRTMSFHHAICYTIPEDLTAYKSGKHAHWCPSKRDFRSSAKCWQLYYLGVVMHGGVHFCKSVLCQLARIVGCLERDRILFQPTKQYRSSK